MYHETGKSITSSDLLGRLIFDAGDDDDKDDGDDNFDGDSDEDDNDEAGVSVSICKDEE